jgi:hypothetical protein
VIEFGSNSLAKFDAGKIWHHPICDNDFGSMFSEQLQRIAPVLSAKHTEAFPRQGLLNKLPVKGRILDD